MPFDRNQVNGLVCGALLAWGCLAAAEPATPLEGTLVFERPATPSGLELELDLGTNRARVEVQNTGGISPVLFSRLQSPGKTVSDWDQIKLLTGHMTATARNVADLRRMGAAGQHAECVADLDGQVLATSANGGFLALADNTGVMLLELRPPQGKIAAGQRVNLEGNCLIEGARGIFRSPPWVDNNDIHAMSEQSNTVYLTVGRHELRLDWFNREYPLGLEVYYAGPGLPRQRIPNSALFRQETDPATGRPRWVNGLDYRCYEGSWLRVPDFPALTPAKEGVVDNFGTGVITRVNDVGLEFKGYVEAPREGLYTFSTISDDGSLVFIDEKPMTIEVIETNALPKPTLVAVGQTLREGEDVGWSLAEGVVTFVSQQQGQAELELSSDTGRMRVEVADGSRTSWPALLRSRIRVTGICLGARTTDGQTVAGTLQTPGMGQVEFWEPEAGRWSAHPAADKSSQGSTNLPVLTQVDQIKRLTREEWQQGYPVKIRGVVTTVLSGGAFIEDPTWSIYARWQPPTDSDVPRVGDYWEVEGKTFAEFAPNIQVNRAARLGAGVLPEPLRPAWDQLINGSLDTKYVEVQGIVTGVHPDGVTLLMRADKIRLELIDLPAPTLRQYENMLIRVRGCVIPVRDINTQQVVPGRIRLSNASITVDELAPKEPFDTPLKHASDLLLFDWRAGAFQRVKITGQILHRRDGEYFLADGKDGLRFIPKTRVDLQPGDLAEAVGFLELGGPSPLLREAVARRTGRANLPEAQALDAAALLNRRLDATLVKVQARLIEISRDASDDILQMQAGTRVFVARLDRRDGPLPALAPGSLLELTGVYAGQGGDLALGREVTSFELLLNSGAGIKTLARPPWWTARRAFTILGGMALAILVALVWIALLRRRVEERSQQLAAEIRRHEHTERQRALEEERARIAQDLHDDLGAALTQFRFLSVLESRDTRASDSARTRMGQIADKSRELVASLDEIVWAVNPTNDSLASLATYLCHFAEEFFNATPIRCRLDVADALPPALLTAEVRHHLYLAVREAVNNIAKHSAAAEVWLRIRAQGPELRIELQDNGRGFDPEAARPFGEGLANMRRRMEKIGGRFECESQPNAGAVYRFFLPLAPAAPD